MKKQKYDYSFTFCDSFHNYNIDNYSRLSEVFKDEKFANYGRTKEVAYVSKDA